MKTTTTNQHFELSITDSTIKNTGLFFKALKRANVKTPISGDNFVKFYINGVTLPDEVEAELYEAAKKEIIGNGNFSNLPDNMIDEVAYYLDIVIEHERIITAVRLGCELFLTSDYRLCREPGADEIKAFAGKFSRDYENNLSVMCGAYTVVDVIPETKEENDLIVHIVKECF